MEKGDALVGKPSEKLVRGIPIEFRGDSTDDFTRELKTQMKKPIPKEKAKCILHRRRQKLFNIMILSRNLSEVPVQAKGNILVESGDAKSLLQIPTT